MSSNVVALTFASALLLVSCTTPTPTPDKPAVDPGQAASTGAKPDDAGVVVARPVDPKDLKTWDEIDALVNEQKFQEALGHAENRLEFAKGKGDEDEWTRALIRVVQLRSGLHGYETSVRFLREQPWPRGDLHRSVLQLFYAQSIYDYVHAYQWEIRQRERVDSKGVVDLKAWTLDQLFEEIQKSYEEVWARREALGEKPVDVLKEYVQPNDYPREVRGSLRDAVSYLRVNLLADTTGWRPEHQNEIFRLDWPALIRADSEAVRKTPLTDPNVHPLQKIAAVLGDLESWHASRGEKAAALEARLERLRRLHGADQNDERRAQVRADLEATLRRYEDLEWWAMGMATLAEFQREEGMLVRAHQNARRGREKYPNTVGGQRCAHLVATIEAPDFTLASMANDGPQKRSVEVSYRNLKAIYFRAYAVDLPRRIASARDYNLLPAGHEMLQFLEGPAKPVAEWTLELPPTPDFQSHKAHSAPPLTKKGLYVIIGSAKKDFSRSDNRLLGTTLIVTELALVTRTLEDGSQEVQVLSGATGEPVPAANVSLYRYDYNRGHHVDETRRTNRDGVVRFERGGGRNYNSFFVLAEKYDDLALDPHGLYFGERYREPHESRTLIYTDRSVYRPLQKVFFKVIAFEGRSEDARFRVKPESTVTVSLMDANGQKVDSRRLRTNSFGSAAGEFTLPTGRLLGHWSLQTSPDGHAAIRVEEYKRPTFEAKLKDPEGALRLNKPATFTGEVKYYFGLPVVTGNVRWRVTREPIFPWWWGWWGWRPSAASTQVIATGTSQLDAEGTFKVTFTPEAEEPTKKEDKLVSYRYRVVADVTDEGGETRTADRAFRLGWVSVEAQVRHDDAFFVAGAPHAFSLYRSDLNGAPRAGKATWRIVEVKQPQAATMPAEQEQPKPQAAVRPEGQPEVVTPGDLKKARWDTQWTLEQELSRWPDGAERTKGEVTHDDKGLAQLQVGALPAGVYRLKYETSDDFGEKYETFNTFIVAGERTPLKVPSVLQAQKSSMSVGETLNVLVQSGFESQVMYLDVYRAQKRVSRREVRAGRDAALISIPVTDDDRGGFSITLTQVRDHQLVHHAEHVFVPWDDKQLTVEFATFRDKIRPGAKETWTVTVKGPGKDAAALGAAELLAYMYDEALDIFAPHTPPSPLGLYPNRQGEVPLRGSFAQAYGQWIANDFASPPGYPSLTGDFLRFHDNYGIGGPGYRLGYRGMGPGGGGRGLRTMAAPSAAAAPAPEALEEARAAPKMKKGEKAKDKLDFADAEVEGALAANKQAPAQAAQDGRSGAAASEPVRSNFAETAFWNPSLITSADGTAKIEFTVPDSVTGWNVWVHAVTKDLKGGSVSRKTRSVKELMVRPYVPRFLRESDTAAIAVVVNNASDKPLSGNVTFDIVDTETQKSVLADFGLDPGRAVAPFTAEAGKGANVSFPIVAPKRPGNVAFRVVARSGNLSDGELRPLPILPSRMHLAQSRFVTLTNADRRELTFADMARNDDPTLIHDQLVVTVDAQLFYTVLQALPYLVNYPYECTEQTLNRFVSSGIVTSLYGQYPSVAAMAKKLSTRETRLETWDAKDPNRKMGLEETPWLAEAHGGKVDGVEQDLVNVLDPRIANAEREASLAKLRKAQTASGGFPWFPGGPPSPYMTVYILHGLARAAEYKVEIPRDMTVRAWAYVAQHYREEYAQKMLRDDCCWEFLTLLNYVASSFPDASYTGDALTMEERRAILNHSFKHWKEHSPYLKGYLALTLKRMDRAKDAKLVWDSVMDSAKTTPDEGTFWAPEDRAWLWYNDTIETHAFALRTLMELEPKDARRHGLVQWLLINKKLNHWKSTKATAEVIYALVKYLEAEGALGIREDATVTIGPKKTTFVFEPDKYTGKNNQIVVPGEQLDPKTMSTVVVEKSSKGFAFASATWHFSTDKLPSEDRGDFFQVSRTYYKREKQGREATLKPLAEGTRLDVGDEVEIHVSLRSKHAAEYVHLRDPRAAGLEPENPVSRYKWDLGIIWYEETRDSGTNFFFEWLPAGEYTFKYRLRANMAGDFRVGPATVQSMYAPEFNAYSAGHLVRVAK